MLRGDGLDASEEDPVGAHLGRGVFLEQRPPPNRYAPEQRTCYVDFGDGLRWQRDQMYRFM